MTPIIFGSPQFFWGLLWLPVFCTMYIVAERRGRARLQQFASPLLLAQLMGSVDRFRRSARFILLLLALTCALAALAKPRMGYAYDEVKRRGLDLMLAVDTSRSMLSNDVQPNRLERVKLATQDLISNLNGDRVGLVAFAGRAFVQAPLTIDYSAAVEAINDLDSQTIPEGGTNISEAIALTARTFGKSALGNRALIIFTDGEELSGDAVKEAKAAADSGVRIFTVGIGTPQGSLIPLASNDGSTAFVKDSKGQVVKSKLDENRLREIAESTGGTYLHLDNGPATMRQLYEQGLAKMQAGDIDARLSRRPIERYEWPLGAAILALVCSLVLRERRRMTQRDRTVTPERIAVAAVVLLASTSGFAAAPGLIEYNHGEFDQAAKQFDQTLRAHPQNRATDRLQFDSGAAAYKLREYDKALQSFSQALLSPDRELQTKSRYNLGNTLYQRGEQQKTDDKKLSDWTNALQHYDETLKLDPQNTEAKENADFVKKKIEELKNKQNQPPTPTPSPSPSPQPNQDQDKKKNDQQKQDQQQQGGGKDEKDQQKEQQDKKSEAQSSPQPGEQGEKKDDPKKDPDKTGDKDSNSSPGPSPSPGSTPSAGQTPSASPGSTPQSSPGPSPGSKGNSKPNDSHDGKGGTSPTPTPGEGSDNDAKGSPSPSPAQSPVKRDGELKNAGEEQPSVGNPGEGEAAAEVDKPGEMSEREAQLLLQSTKDEEARVQLDERKARRRVYNDW